ncbi:hypothetical protein V2J09_004540 [Rumex salicifolius]
MYCVRLSIVLKVKTQGIDVILGYSWLLSMKKKLVDWETKTVELNDRNGKHVTTQGDPSLAFTAFSRISCTSDVQPKLENLNLQRLDKMNEFLMGFQDLFEELKGLPPKREVDHKIVLQDGVTSINVNPYRYGFHQKDEIEKMGVSIDSNKVVSVYLVLHQDL